MKAINYHIIDKDYLSVEIGTINAPQEKRYAQRKQGIFVASGSIKSLKALISKNNINCIICYTNPNNSEFIEDLLTEAVYNNKTVYIKTKDDFKEFYPRTSISVNKDLRNRDRKLDRKRVYEDMFTERDLMNNHRIIPEERKTKMRKYIRYYEMDMPTNEIEWVETFDNLVYYIKNNIPYAFDTNKYYICEECGELVHRGTEHICYCDIPYKRLKIDYLVNGEE